MTKLFGFLFALLCCTAAFGQQAYNTQDEAAIAALHSITQTDIEYAGIVYELNNQFYFSEPQTNNETADFNIRVSFPKGGHFVALFHNHPGTEDISEYFSPGDVEIAKRLNVTSYILVTRSNTIHRFIPGVDKVVDYKRVGARISSGEITIGKMLSTT